MILPCQRTLFEIPKDVAYLNCAYWSPLLKAGREAGEKALLRKSNPWTLKPEHFFAEAEDVRSLFARLIGGHPDRVAFVPSASYAVAIAARNISCASGQEIVVLAEQFPSNIYAWKELAKKTGATIRTVPRPANHDWTMAVLSALHERTAVAALPHCHWTDGSLVDLERVSRRCREVGAALVVDATQSLGAMPLNLAAVQPDFLLAASYKWLLGPYSHGFVYVSEKYSNGEPLEWNWLSREGSEDFAQLVNYRDSYQLGARRFEMGGRSNFFLLPIVRTALEQILEWGVANIQESISEMTAAVEDEAGRCGLDPVPSARCAGHMIGLRFHGAIPSGLKEELLAERVFVSFRGNAVRVSPYLYNDAEDLHRFLTILSKFAN